MTASVTTVATLPVIRALIDEARRKHYTGGVLGVQAPPEWDGPVEFEHDGTVVRVVACPSSLAVREALLDRDPGRWLVILTDRDDAELGLGITAHLAWRRLRRPDPWAAVQDRFGATSIDHRLVAAPSARDVATGLLAATPPGGWPPARAGLLSGDHVFGSVAATRLGLGDGTDAVDLTAVLRWSTLATAATAVADLRAIAGEALVEALLGWLAERCGACGGVVAPLLREGRSEDLVPLGLVARIVATTDAASAPRALLARELGGRPGDQVLVAWATEAELVTRDLLREDPDSAARVLARAESMVDRVEAADLAGRSGVLRRGLTARLAVLGEALRRCAARAPVRAAADGPDAPLIDATALAEAEDHLRMVTEHLLASQDGELQVYRAIAGVRLARWLALPVSEAAGLGSHIERYRDEDAWAERAAAEAWRGGDAEGLAQGLRAVLAAARIRRDAHDRAFAHALAAHHEGGGPAPTGLSYLEDLLATTVLPLAKRHPVLLVVADGMSQSVATEVVDDVVRSYDTWLEALPGDRDRRLAAIAVLPSLTEVSRASLFCGELTTGNRDHERAGFTTLARSHGLRGELFFKADLDGHDGGYALAHDVAAAIDDTAGLPVVACVLNTIDDALDRADPAGIEWTADTVKHLRPLLERARRAGRAVVLTSDHGHVLERRDGRLLPVPEASSNRSRPYAGGAVLDDGEIRIRGRRVCRHDGDAVLAVDQRIRYGPLKAGYHGGAAPAEVVVPVSVLALGEPPQGWRHAPPQAPAWWRAPLREPAPLEIVDTATASAPIASRLRSKPGSGDAPTLFDANPEEVGAAAIARVVISSPVYREQRRRAARAAITDEQVHSVLAALLAAPDHRLDPESAAAALGVAEVQLTGALSQAQRLLNVEQYPVLSRDADGVTVVLDAALMREQFGVGS